MISIARLFQRGKRRGAQANLKLVDAYKAVFSARATLEEAEIVLADIANTSGLYVAEAAGADALALAQANGRREVALRILSMLRLSREQRDALFDAAQAEQLADETEGLI